MGISFTEVEDAVQPWIKLTLLYFRCSWFRVKWTNRVFLFFIKKRPNDHGLKKPIKENEIDTLSTRWCHVIYFSRRNAVHWCVQYIYTYDKRKISKFVTTGTERKSAYTPNRWSRHYLVKYTLSKCNDDEWR